jgi:preprotein translocase subunit SecA
VDPAFPKRGRTECCENPPCGLHVIGTERHEARRIDNQLRGRSGRQGDPGSSRFFLSLEDDLMRIFARDWVTKALDKLGMEEGMALEHRWLTRGIENAQKKVEERNFGVRKHLLEYDEVMDRQRKVFYGRRQRTLESGDLRDFVWTLLEESVEKAIEEYLSDTYSYETIAEWARRNVGAQVETGDLAGRDAEQAVEFLKAEARQWARDSIDETLDDFLPPAEDEADAAEEKAGPEPDEDEPKEERPRGADYRGLAQWARGRLGVDFKEYDLRRMPADKIADFLFEAADKRIEALDFGPVAAFLKADFREAALADWVNRKFDVGLKAGDLAGKKRDQVADLVLGHVRRLYAEKERTYPIEFAIEEHLAPQIGHAEQDFAALAQWASHHYLAAVDPHAIRSRRPEIVRERLLGIAREFESSGRLRATLEQAVRDRWPHAHPERADAWPPLIQWAKETLGLEIVPQEIVEAVSNAAEAEKEDLERSRRTGEPPSHPSPQEAVIALLEGRARADRRSRMTELERYLLLQVHDTSWKDHLREMDVLRSAVALHAYAERQPIQVFQREGFKLFEDMLSGVRDKFTDLIFKARWVRQEALARIWAGQSTEHAEAASAFEAQRQAAMEATQHAQMREEGESVIKTIVREQPKVGRNDPCPCGSGKKYKKCCGRRA